MTKAEKATYDRDYRLRNREKKQAQAAAYFQRTYDPAAAAIVRKGSIHIHVEYCRRPSYRAKKKDYDRKRRMEVYGEFADAFLALQELQREIRKQMPDRFERYAQAKRKQWNPLTQQRRRNGNPVDAIDSH